MNLSLCSLPPGKLMFTFSCQYRNFAKAWSNCWSVYGFLPVVIIISSLTNNRHHLSCVSPHADQTDTILLFNISSQMKMVVHSRTPSVCAKFPTQWLIGPILNFTENKGQITLSRLFSKWSKQLFHNFFF